VSTMNLATCSRRGVPSLQALSRYYSSDKGKQLSESSFSTEAQSHKTLPPAKMRALIALYHQADSWITPENLEDRIDNTFVPDPNSAPRNRLDTELLNPRGGWTRLDDLDKMRRHMRMAPKMAQWNRSLAADYVGSDWSIKASKRELKVIEALYGVDAPVDKDMLPGLELLQENADKLTRDKKEGEEDTEQDLPQRPRGRSP